MKADILDKLPEKLRKNLPEEAFPKKISPMLATLTDDYFSDPAWIFERKLDGERCIVFYEKGKVSLRSRNRKELGTKYPELTGALEKSKGTNYVADGEIVAFVNGQTSFSALQPRMQQDEPTETEQAETPVYLYLFDLIHADGYKLTDLPLRSRKDLLRSGLDFHDPIRFVNHRNEKGEAYHREACAKGWEGVIAKKADSTYVQSRSRNWLKFKCVASQELVVGGFTDPQGSRVGFGALLLGYYEKGELQYAGKVGTGFDNEFLQDLRDKMNVLEREESPFRQDVGEKGVHWIKPELVAEIGFTEWTHDHKLRHPRFLGLRDDKVAREVHREKP